MVQSQWTLVKYKKTKKTTIKVKRLRILRIIKPTVQGVEAKLRILVEEDI